MGEERQHRAGALAAAGDVVLLKRRVGAVVADRVEVQVEALLAGCHPQFAQAAHRGGQQRLVGGAAHAVGVARQVRGLGQRGQPERQSQPAVVCERVAVADARHARALGQKQRAHRVPRRQRRGRRVAAGGDQLGQPEFDDRGDQQQQSGVVAGDLLAGRPVLQRAGLDRRKARRRHPPLGGRAARQALQALAVKDAPDRLRGHRRSRRRKRGSDLLDRAIPGAQREHFVADPACLAGPLGPGLAVAKERGSPGAQIAGHLMHHRGRVPESCRDLRRAELVDEVRTQRLVAALRRLTRLREVLRPSTHLRRSF